MTRRDLTDAGRRIVKRNDAEADEHTLKMAKRGHQRRRYNQVTIAAAVFLVPTSLPNSAMTGEAVLDTYRLRWQN